MGTFERNDETRNDSHPLRTFQPIRSLPEVGKILGIPESQVKYYENKALDKLRDALISLGYGHSTSHQH